MAQLQTDKAQLALNGAVGASYTPPPNMPVDVAGEQRRQSSALLARLGDVMAKQAITRQEMLNSAMVTDAINSATAELDKITQDQLERKGWQVGKQSATDTQEERQDAITEYTQRTSQMLDNVMPKLMNDKQREMFSMQMTGSVISNASTVAQHVFNENRQTLINGYNSRKGVLTDKFINYGALGDFNKGQEILRDAKNYIPGILRTLGYSDVEIEAEINNFMNNAIGKTADILTQNGQYNELGILKMKFGDALTTGATKEVLNRQAVHAENVSKINDIINKISQDPSLKDANGNYDLAKVRSVLSNWTTTQSTVTIDTQAIGSGQTAVDIIYDTMILTENSGETAENPESGAYGREQLTPGTFEGIKNGILGSGRIPPDASLKDPYYRKLATQLYIKDLYEKANYDPVVVAVGYAGGEPMMKAYMANPNSSDWDKITVAGDQTVRQYIQKWSENLAKHDGVSTAKKMPTANIPISKGDNPDLEHLKPELRAAIPVIGGMLTQLGYGDVMLLTSGYRTKEYQMRLNPKAPNSYHIYGDALDIFVGENLSQEAQDTLVQTFKNTGAFNDVFYHNSGSGYHLHLQGYNGKLGDGSNIMGIVPTTRTLYKSDPAFASQLTQTAMEVFQARNATTASNLNKAIQSLYGQSYADENAVVSALQAVKYVDGDGKERSLTPEQIAQFQSGIWGSSTTYRNLVINNRNFQLQQQEYTKIRQQRSENAYQFRQQFARGVLDGSIKTFADFQNSSAYGYATDDDILKVKESFEKGNTQNLARGQQMVETSVKSIGMVNYKDHPTAYWSIYNEVESQVIDYMDSHNGQLPPTYQIDKWTQTASQQQVVNEGFFTDDTIPASQGREYNRAGNVLNDDGTLTNPSGVTEYYSNGVYGVR